MRLLSRIFPFLRASRQPQIFRSKKQQFPDQTALSIALRCSYIKLHAGLPQEK